MLRFIGERLDKPGLCAAWSIPAGFSTGTYQLVCHSPAFAGMGFHLGFVSVLFTWQRVEP